VSTEPTLRPFADPARNEEQEVELSRYWEALLRGWWLILLGVVLGAVIGYLVSLGGGRVYQARATIYLGQPLNSNGSGAVLGPSSNPTIVNQIIKSESVIEEVAAKVGMLPSKLRKGIASSAVSGGTQKTSQTPLVTITVRGPAKRPTADAANMLADIAVTNVSRYADEKIQQLEARAAAQQQQLDGLDSAIADYQASAQNGSLTPQERLVAGELLTTAVIQRGEVAQERSDTELQLSQAKLVERGQVVTRASATKVSAKSKRSSLIVGAVIGLLLGAVAALAWEPLRLRARLRRARRAQ
jgi:capsular polysaccharide biosynthesis protein